MEKLNDGSRNVIVAMRRTPWEQDKAFVVRIQEMIGLCEAAGAVVAEIITQVRAKPDVVLYLGKGKIEQLAVRIQELQTSCVIFDSELSPAQIRNLEVELHCQVVDRTQIILDIFASRAMSKAGRIQVEIAQLRYLLPRLAGRGSQMSRLGAGIGTRGPGETKLETDRRRIHKRISHLGGQLRRIERIRGTQRASRIRNMPIVALVGYTNAGKTTVLHRWGQSRGAVSAPQGHERMFDTLDPSARRMNAGMTGGLVVLDTVGFIRNLPHLLIDAFHSTLEEVLAADLIVQVVDASDDVETHLNTTYQVLRDIGADSKPRITFFNKMDKVQLEPAPDARAMLSVFGSAQSGDGMKSLLESIEHFVGLDPVEIEVTIPPDAKNLWSRVSQAGKIVRSFPEEDGSLRLTICVDRKDLDNWNQTFGALQWDKL